MSEDTDHEAKVTDAVGEEGFFSGVCGGVFMIPVANEQVGRESNQFPEDEHHDEVRCQHNTRHGEHEQ